MSDERQSGQPRWSPDVQQLSDNRLGCRSTSMVVGRQSALPAHVHGGRHIFHVGWMHGPTLHTASVRRHEKACRPIPTQHPPMRRGCCAPLLCAQSGMVSTVVRTQASGACRGSRPSVHWLQALSECCSATDCLFACASVDGLRPCMTWFADGQKLPRLAFACVLRHLG